MRGKTRRDQIVGEHRREQIRFIALCGAALVLILSLLVSCARSCDCSCGSGEIDIAASRSDEPAETEELKLTDEDIAFLRSLTEYPRLVSTESPLPDGYAPPNPIKLHGMPDGEANQLNYDAANAFYQLREAMQADGMAVDPLSGYRTYEEQVAIFNYNVQLHTDEGMTPEEALAYTERFVAVPGTSEHQYGRSIDVTMDGTTNHSFHETEQGQWLIAHAHEYGYIIRYPSDKTGITGINYEPWHLRWVGNEHAAFIHKHKLCLEEYIDLVNEYNPAAVMCDD